MWVIFIRSDRHAAGSSHGADSRQHLVALCVTELDGSLLAIVERLQVRPLVERKLEQLIDIRRRRFQSLIVIDQVVNDQMIEAEHASSAAMVEATLFSASRVNSFACDKLTSAKLKSSADLSLLFVIWLTCVCVVCLVLTFCFATLSNAWA